MYSLIASAQSDPVMEDFYIMEKELDLDMRKVFLDFEAESVLSLFEKGDDDDDEKEKPKGLLGMISNGFKAIIKFLKGIINKVKELLTGKAENKETKFDKDPSKVAELADKYIGDDLDALRNFRSGKMSVSKFIDFGMNIVANHQEELKTVAAFAGPILSCMGIKAGKGYLDKWDNAMQDALDANQENMAESYEKIARASNSENQRKEINNATEKIMTDIRQNVSMGSNAIFAFFNSLYVKGRVKKNVRRTAELMQTKEGRKQLDDERAARVQKEEEKQAALKELNKNIKKGTKEQKSGASAVAKAREETHAQKTHVFRDYGDEDETKLGYRFNKKKKEIGDKVKETGEKINKITNKIFKRKNNSEEETEDSDDDES